MKRHGNLFPKIVDMDNIRLAYQRAKRQKGWMRAVKKFSNNLEANLLAIQQSLINKTFTTSPYRIKYAYYPKFREIFIVPFAPDRIVQHALMSVVEPIWDSMLIDNTVSCRKGMGTERAYQLAAKFVNTNSYCLKCDISKFYPSINHDILFDLIQHKIKCPDTLWLLKDIVYSYGRQFNTETNSPIGNYTSQWFGNLYMDIIDRLAINEFKVDYVRYCDDFLFFSNSKEQLRTIQDMLPEYLFEQRKLKLSKSNIFPTSLGLDFIGYRFFPDDYILLRKRVAKVYKRRFRGLHKLVDKGNDISKFRKAKGQIASAVGLLERCDSHNFKLSTGFYSLVKEAEIVPKVNRSTYQKFGNKRLELCL